MNSGEDAVIAVREERARIGGVEVAKKTVIAATEQGVIAFEINTVEASGYGNNNARPALSSYPQQHALPAPPSQIVISEPPERDCKYYCCACDSEYEWYELKGKGICWVLLLLLFYLIIGAIILPFVVLFWVHKCLTCCSDD